jgi:hypothetical protein
MIWSELCRQALQISNLAPRGQTADPELNQDALDALHMILSEWSRDGLLEPAFKNTIATLTGSQQFYSMGTGGDFDARPLDILQVILSGSTLNNTNYPIQVRDWAEFKSLTFPGAYGLPQYAFYNPVYPLGVMALYPFPNANWTCEVQGLFAWGEVLPTDTVSLPPGYDSVFLDTLANKLRQNYNLSPLQWLSARASSGMAAIRIALPVKDKSRDNWMATRIWNQNVRNWATDSPR